MKFMSILLITLMIYPINHLAHAADPPVPPNAAENVGGGGEVEEIRMGLKSDIQLIFFAGLGGAALGLSTLSFVDKPSRELRRIAYGFALGTILASVLVLYKTTSKSMTGKRLPTINSLDYTAPSEDYNDKGEEYIEGDEGEEEEYYDEDFYGSINSFYLASIGKNGLKIGLPLFDIGSNENNNFFIRANLFRMTF
jgi:hypothetical protein